MRETEAIVRRLAAADPEEAHVLATLVTVEGSSYRQPGARMLLASNGARLGAISGGCLEEDVIAKAAAVAKTGRTEVALYDTTSENDLIWGVGLGCHGVVRVLIERLPPRPAWALAVAENLRRGQPSELAVVWRAPDPFALGTRLADMGGEGAPGRELRVFRQTVAPAPMLHVFGAGDDAQPLVRLAAELGWRITVADPRPAFATQERFPGADRLVCAPAQELVARTAPGPGNLAVVMTHRYVHDVPALRDLLPLPLAYLGLLGPKKRAEKILEDLAAERGRPVAQSAVTLSAPAGLDIGGESPEAVALSILAEMQASLAGRDGQPLRERTGPIHE